MSGYANLTSGEFVAVTKSDTVTLSYNGKQAVSKFIIVGGTGDIACKNSLGDTVVVKCTAGYPMPIQTNHILSTSTDATAIVAIF